MRLKAGAAEPIQKRKIIKSSTISFVAGSTGVPATIKDTAIQFLIYGFGAGQVITLSDTTSNNKSVTIAKATRDTLTLIDTDTLVNEAAGASKTFTTAINAPAFSAFFG